MFIPSTELAELVARTGAGAAPLERGHLTTTLDTIQRANIIARTDSAASRFLRNLTDQHRHFFTGDVAALLGETDLFGVDLPYVNAVPRMKRGRRQVVVFTGLLQTVQFYAELIQLLHLMLHHRPDATLVIDGQREREALAFSSAAFASLAGLIDQRQPLPTIRRLLGPKARKHAAIGYLFAVLFIIAHEVGHLQLGHLEWSPDLSERMPVSFAVPELLDRCQTNELEADAFALKAFREQSRESIIPSVLFFLGPFALLEAFARVDDGYPLSLNRADHLRGLIAQDSETAQVAGDVLKQSVAGYHRLATLEGKGGNELREAIHQRMPPARAEWILREVAQRLRSEGSSLDTPD